VFAVVDYLQKWNLKVDF